MKIDFLLKKPATIAGAGFIVSNLMQVGSAKTEQNTPREIAAHGFNIANIMLLASENIHSITPPALEI